MGWGKGEGVDPTAQQDPHKSGYGDPDLKL